jgi:hypothetical protein
MFRRLKRTRDAGVPPAPPGGDTSANSEPVKLGDVLNGAQTNHVVITLAQIDRLLEDAEELLQSDDSGSAFPRYLNDVDPEQKRAIQEFAAQFRARILHLLSANGIEPPSPRVGVRHAIKTNLEFIDLELEELLPRNMRGYGEVDDRAATPLNDIVRELQSSVRDAISGIPEK